MIKNRRGYLLIEVILGLSIFAIFAGCVTQIFLLGFKLHATVTEDPNEGFITNILINRIKSGSVNPNTEIGLPIHYDAKSKYEEKWVLKVKGSTDISERLFPGRNRDSNGGKLYALEIEVQKTEHRDFSKPDSPSKELEKKTYKIFRYVGPS
jgi:hypothetical protein